MCSKFLRTPNLWLEIMVIIKIEFHLCYSIVCGWFYWGWKKEIILKFEIWNWKLVDSKTVIFSNPLKSTKHAFFSTKMTFFRTAWQPWTISPAMDFFVSKKLLLRFPDLYWMFVQIILLIVKTVFWHGNVF